MRLCVLGSGSRGNATLVMSGGTLVLIDAGLSGKETVRRLEVIGVDPAQLSAVCVTHEHDDHTSSLGVLHRRNGVALYANSGTLEGMERYPKLRELPWNVFSTGSPFEIGSLRLDPFSVPHDSYDPVGFIVGDGTVRVGIATDMGMATEMIRDRLKGCSVLVAESNHDEDMLQASGRPWSLKQRIKGRHGHMSNSQAAQLIKDVAGEQLHTVVLAHLSAECNTPKLAERVMRAELDKAGLSRIVVEVASPDHPTRVIEVSAKR